MGARIKWAPKLPPQLLQKLYKLNALGINDDELLDDVGLRLFLRCESIVLISQRAFVCPSCGEKLCFQNNTNADENITCVGCNSQYSKTEYHNSYRHRDLWQGNAGVYFARYYEDYPRAKTYGEKLIAIDTLIHAFHIDARLELPNRVAGNNLLEGSLRKVVELLDELSGVQPDNDAVFRENVELMWKRRKGIIE